MPIDQYFNNMPEDRRLKAQSVHKLILELFPQSKVNLKYKMPTYEAEKGRQAIGNQKNYWSVYTCCLEKISAYLASNPQVKHGVDCINFRKKDEVDLKAMKKVILQAMSG